MKFRNILKHLPFVFASLWSIGVGIYLLRTPWMMVQDAIGNVSVETFYQAEGLRIPLIFALLFSSTAVLATTGCYIALVILSLLATTYTIMAIFTVGAAYVPSVIAIVVG